MALQREELQAWLRLTLSPGVGNQSARRLLAALGSAEAVFEAAPARLNEQVTPAQALALSQPPAGLPALLERTWRWLQTPAEGLCHQVLTLGDPAYPADLLQLADPPLMLYALSGQPLPPSQGPLQAVAVVGSRNPSAQGLENAQAFAHSLVGQGFCVVSGLALGIDGAAHEGALNAAAGAPPDTAGPLQWPTLAVVGTGLDRVYPRQHRALAHRVALQGVMLSEYPLGTPPLAANFPKRNRLIAALSRGTLVVEAALASGSLVTARLAVEQGKEVFAIPGSIHAPQSRGCHALIRQGAKLVETVQDILEELPSPRRPSRQPELPGLARPGAAGPAADAGTQRPAEPPAWWALSAHRHGLSPGDGDGSAARIGSPKGPSGELGYIARMMDVLVFVYENYGRSDACPELTQLSHKLTAVGFESEEIEQALDWLEDLQQTAAGMRAVVPRHGSSTPPLTRPRVQKARHDSVRAYLPREIEHLGSEGLGFLLFLQAAKALPTELHEVVMERATAAHDRPLTLDELKIIIRMVFWQFDHEPSALVLDELCHDRSTQTLH